MSIRCRRILFPWSVDLLRDQCSDCPGLCLSFPSFDQRAAPAIAAGKYRKNPSFNGTSLRASEPVGNVFVMARKPRETLRLAPCCRLWKLLAVH